MIHVFVDTSALRSDIRLTSAAVREIHELSSRGKIALHIHEVVWREFESQIVAQVHAHLEKSIASLASAQRIGLPAEMQDEVRKADGLLNRIDAQADRVVRDELTRWMKRGRVVLDKIAPSHAKRVFDAYFAGHGAFRAEKSRDDLPDAFILEAVRDRCAKLADDDEVHVVVKDDRLGRACGDCGAFVHAEFDSFLHTESVRRASEVMSRKKQQEWIVAAVRLAKKHAEVPGLLRETVSEWLRGQTVALRGLRGLPDLVQADIVDVPLFRKAVFRWADVSSYGTATLVVPAMFDVEADVKYTVDPNLLQRRDGPGVAFLLTDRQMYVSQKCRMRGATNLALEMVTDTETSRPVEIRRASLGNVRVEAAVIDIR